MRCALTPEMWQAYIDTGDPRVAAHLASCAACRAEADRYARLAASLDTLPQLEAPATVKAELARLEPMAEAGELTCAMVQDVLEPYREGELDESMTFLVEDHLLWCEPCTLALEQADRLSVLLHELPAVEVPAAVAERVAAGRIPWWQRLFPQSALGWQRAGWLAASIALVFALGQSAPRLVAHLSHRDAPAVALAPVATPSDQLSERLAPRPIPVPVPTPANAGTPAVATPLARTKALGAVKPVKRHPAPGTDTDAGTNVDANAGTSGGQREDERKDEPVQQVEPNSSARDAICKALDQNQYSELDENSSYVTLVGKVPTTREGGASSI